MGILKKAINLSFETGANYGLGNSLNSTMVSTLFGEGGASIDVLKEYNGLAWKCINIRAEYLSKEDLFVERLVGKKWQPDQQHDFNTILEGGAGQYDQSELLEAHEKSLCLYGESFWYFSKQTNGSKPFAVYLLDPAAVTVMVADDRVTGYVYQLNGERATFDLDEIEHFRVIDPRRNHKYRGYGPMQAAGWFIRSNRYVMTYVNNFLENNAIPAGVIVAKEAVNDTDWQLFKQEWTSKYSGIDNSGKTGFVRGTDLDFVKTGLSLGEVDFENIKNSSREDIMVMFGISKPMMAIFQDINRASATVSRQLFAETVTEPALMKLKRRLSKKVALWYGDQFRVNATNPIPDDEDVKLQAFDKGVGRWFTINEARAAYGLDPISGGDVIEPAVAPQPTGKRLKSVGTIRVKVKTRGFSYEMKESFRSETEGIQLKNETLFLEAANPILKAQKQTIIAQLQPKKLLDSSFNASDEAGKLAEGVMGVLIGLAEEQGILAANVIGAKFTLTEVMRTYIQDSIKKSCASFTEETQTRIAAAVADGLQNGDSIKAITSRIDDIYADVLGVDNPGYRLERLARTEVIKTSNEITEAAYRQSGVVQKKEWFANPGACEFCESLDGSVLGLGASFVPRGTQLEGTDGGSQMNDYEDVNYPPFHPNCRCTLLPVVGDL